MNNEEAPARQSTQLSWQDDMRQIKRGTNPNEDLRSRGRMPASLKRKLRDARRRQAGR